ncbi:hypothetical protein BHM03_00056298 [Ensete ventricosum]|nr:hypothetical protein BHM03_00056298 [Ensete ventricosum]
MYHQYRAVQVEIANLASKKYNKLKSMTLPHSRADERNILSICIVDIWDCLSSELETEQEFPGSRGEDSYPDRRDRIELALITLGIWTRRRDGIGAWWGVASRRDSIIVRAVS